MVKLQINLAKSIIVNVISLISLEHELDEIANCNRFSARRLGQNVERMLTQL